MWKSLVLVFFSFTAGPGVSFALFGFTPACQVLWTYENQGHVSSLAMSNDGRYIAMVKQPNFFGDTTLSMFSNNSSDPLWNYTLSPNGTVWEFTSISDDGGYLTVSGDYTPGLRGAGLFRSFSNKPVWTLGNNSFGYPPPWFDARVSGNGQYTVLRSQTENLAPQSSLTLRRNPTMTLLWYFNTSYYNALRSPIPLSISHEGAYVVAVDPSGDYLGYMPRLSVFSQHDNRTLWTSKAYWVSAAISGNGDRIVARTNTTISVFGLSSNQTLLTITSPWEPFSVSQDGSTLAFLSGLATLQVYDLTTGLELFSANANSSGPLDVAVSADGSRIALFNGSHLFVYGRSGKSICEATVPPGESPLGASVAISGDGQWIALGGAYLSYVRVSSTSPSAQEILFFESVGAVAIVAGTVAFGLLIRRHKRRNRKSQVATAN